MKPKNKPHHYKECGLDNVYLLNGFHIHTTTHGRGISFENIVGLHKAIGKTIAKGEHDLSGKEFRFLRKEMEMTQSDVALLFDCDAQTVARWEKGQTSLPTTADRLIRVIYLEYLKENSGVLKLLEQLAHIDAYSSQKLCFEETQRGWKRSA